MPARGGHAAGSSALMHDASSGLPRRGAALLPQTKPADERVGVVAGRQPGGSVFELLDVAAAEHARRRARARRRKRSTTSTTCSPPLLRAQSLRARGRRRSLRTSLSCRAGGRAPSARRCRRRSASMPSPVPQPEEQHLAAVVTAERLHRRVVDEFHRPPERRLRSRNPSTRRRGCAARAISRLQHRPRIADRDEHRIANRRRAA